jgi:hypothetical protein
VLAGSHRALGGGRGEHRRAHGCGALLLASADLRRADSSGALLLLPTRAGLRNGLRGRR